MKIMFVCSGNTCRSPMAEAILKDLANVEVCSAGFSTLSGERASNKSMIVCSNHDLDISNHRTSNVFESEIEDMDLVLTLTVSQKDKLKNFYPDLEIYTVKEYAGGYDTLDIQDPYGDSLKAYEFCFCEIKESLLKIVETHGF